jgi:hypothetical protein
LRLSRTGEWIYGSEDAEVEQGSKWLVHTGSLSMGFASWGDGELLGESMASLFATPIDKSTLPDTGEAWDPQVAMLLVCLSGQDKGQQVMFKATSKGGTRAFSDLLNAIMGRVATGEQQALCPVIHLGRGSYTHKKYGKIFYPVFEVVSWTQATTTEPEADEPESEPAPAPTGRRRRRVV